MISLLHPSRGRPEKSFNNTKEWIEKAGCEVELIVSIDQSDNTKEEYSKKYLDTKNTFLCYENDSVVQATNRAAKESKGDILVYLSDDFKSFLNWGGGSAKSF